MLQREPQRAQALPCPSALVKPLRKQLLYGVHLLGPGQAKALYGHHKVGQEGHLQPISAWFF